MRFPSTVRSCPTSQTQPRATVAQTPIAPEASSAAELVAGDSLHPRRPNDHREDRPGLAVPSRPSGARGEPPFAGVDRRCLAAVRAEEVEGEQDWSNLTRGPPGPTVSDPDRVHAGVSGSANPRVRLLCFEDVFCPKRFPFFCFILKNRID